MLNEKLEKQILNNEIRQNLAKLEGMALHSEKQLREAQKILKRLALIMFTSFIK